VGLLNDRFIRLPRAIALLLGSLIVSLFIAAIDPFVTPDLSGWVRGMLGAAAPPEVLLHLVLGLLLFAASLHVDLTQLRSQKWTVLILATASVILSTIVFGGGIWALFQLAGSPIELRWCMVLGAVLAPTDAVVIDAVERDPLFQMRPGGGEVSLVERGQPHCCAGFREQQRLRTVLCEPQLLLGQSLHHL
jgi:CPA1 family monovalent cation:H+ antiporter